MARPMPLPPPITSALRPASENASSRLSAAAIVRSSLFRVRRVRAMSAWPPRRSVSCVLIAASGARTASTFWCVIRCLGPTTHIEAITLAGVAEHRHRDAAQALELLLVVDRIAGAADAPQLGLERATRGDRLRRERRSSVGAGERRVAPRRRAARPRAPCRPRCNRRPVRRRGPAPRAPGRRSRAWRRSSRSPSTQAATLDAFAGVAA